MNVSGIQQFFRNCLFAVSCESQVTIVLWRSPVTIVLWRGSREWGGRKMKLERMRGLTAAQLRRTVYLSLRLQALLLLVIITSMQKLQSLKVSHFQPLCFGKIYLSHYFSRFLPYLYWNKTSGVTCSIWRSPSFVSGEGQSVLSQLHPVLEVP